MSLPLPNFCACGLEMYFQAWCHGLMKVVLNVKPGMAIPVNSVEELNVLEWNCPRPWCPEHQS